MKLRVVWPGKTRKAHFKSAIEDYASRIGKLIPFEIVETREEPVADRARARRVRRESESMTSRRRAAASVVLDASGREMTSEQFAAWLARQTDDIDFFVGGPEGCRIEDAGLVLCLGKITLPHELARVVLLEQIYRALTIIKRIPYHK